MSLNPLHLDVPAFFNLPGLNFFLSSLKNMKASFFSIHDVSVYVNICDLNHEYNRINLKGRI